MARILKDPFADTDRVVLRTLAQLAQRGDWQLDLLHDRPHHLLIWITRGQGLAVLDGVRRGMGTHNVLFVPTGTTLALELGRPGFGQALVIPDGTDLRLPGQAHHLRIRDVTAQTELTALFEALQREQTNARPLLSEAMEAQTALVSVWLRRHLGLDEHAPKPLNAANRLSRALCRRIAQEFRSGAPMAEYASALGVTPTHLTRACKASTGRTAADLLTERTLYEARHLLVFSDVQIQDIARYLGFGSAAYFTRFMQHHTRRTPSELRKAPPPKVAAQGINPVRI